MFGVGVHQFAYEGRQHPADQDILYRVPQNICAEVRTARAQIHQKIQHDRLDTLATPDQQAENVEERPQHREKLLDRDLLMRHSGIQGLFAPGVES